MSYVRKTEISGNLINLIYFFTYTILTTYLVILGTIKFGMDSAHYVNDSVIRASFYPSFLNLYAFFFGNSYRFLIFIKILFAIFSIHYFLNFFKKKFNLSEPLVYLFTIVLLTPYFFGDYKFANRIFTEGICYPLYLVSLVFLFRYLFEKKLKFFLYFLFTLSILILTRRQFFFMYPLIIIVISYSHFFLKENKKTLSLILCFLSTVFFTEIVERSYRFIKFDEFKPPPFGGIQLIAAPLYLSEIADLSLFNDPEEKQILREVLNEMSSRKLNFVNSRNTQYENYYQHFSANYNKITWGILYKKMKDKNLDWFQIDKICTSAGVKLIMNDPVKHFKLYFFSFKEMLGGYYLMVFYLILFFFSAIKVFTRKSNISLLLFITLLCSFSNYVLISLVEPPLMRYTIYTEITQIIVFLIIFYNFLFGAKYK